MILPKVRDPTEMSVAARAVDGSHPRSRPRRPAAPQRALLVRVL